MKSCVYRGTLDDFGEVEVKTFRESLVFIFEL